MSVEDLQKALEELFSDFLSTKLTYPQFDEKFKKLFSVFQKTHAIIDRKQLLDLVKDAKEVFDEIDSSDMTNHIIIISGRLCNSLNKLLECSGSDKK